MELNGQDLKWSKENIKKNELFSACSEAELDELAGGLEKECYHPGSTILFQGEISSRLCMIQSGQVSVWVRKMKEKTKVADLGEGSIFGEISLLTPKAAMATIKSEAETEVIFLPGEVVQAMAKRNPAFSERLRTKIEERLNKSKQATENKDEQAG
jgi:signal-transduction protein with cAMP-binding, CBS, and nucleotidyltransferase domain